VVLAIQVALGQEGPVVAPADQEDQEDRVLVALGVPADQVPAVVLVAREDQVPEVVPEGKAKPGY